MTDSQAHLDVVDRALGDGHPEIRVCLDLDVSWRPLARQPAVHIGTRRSPLHTPEQAADFARAITRRPGFRLVGVMGYEGQIAGLGDAPPGHPVRARMIRLIQGRSMPELVRRRTEAIRQIQAVTSLEFVNGGGTGSLESTARDASVTELTAGSGLVGPDPVRRVPPVQARARPALRPAGGAPARVPAWPRCSPAATSPPAPEPRTGCPARTCRPASASPGPRARARCRPRSAARPRTSCGPGTGCGCATPRRRAGRALPRLPRAARGRPARHRAHVPGEASVSARLRRSPETGQVTLAPSAHDQGAPASWNHEPRIQCVGPLVKPRQCREAWRPGGACSRACTWRRCGRYRTAVSMALVTLCPTVATPSPSLLVPRLTEPYLDC
jgi:hypothetical protein